MSQIINARRRTCNICKKKIRCSPTNDQKCHNCASLTTDLLGELPNACWKHSPHPFIDDILLTIPAYQQKGPRSVNDHQKRIELGSEVLDATKKSYPEKDFWLTLAEKYGKRRLLAFYGYLPESSVLHDLLKPIVSTLTALPDRPKGKPKPEFPLPKEMESAVQLYTERSEYLYKIKIERGHKYQLKSSRRRSMDARKFCEFLTRRGLQFWAEVSQYDLDEYIQQTNRGAGARVYTFLLFVKANFRLTQRFIRPRIKLKPPCDVILDQQVTKEVLQRIVRSENLQAVIASLFLAIFGQTIVRSSQLKLDDFKRREDGRLMVKFAEEWMPIDPLTEKFLCKFVPNIGETSVPESGDAPPLFSYTKDQLGYVVNKLTAIPLKPLRMTAIANIIRSGITDRGAINRLLGVSLQQIAYVEKAFEWDLQSTVPPEIVAARNEVIRGERTE